MKMNTLRRRAWLAALLPVTLVAAALTSLFVWQRVTALENAHRERTVAQARQVAGAAEFPLFAGNQGALDVLVQRARQEADVRSVAILGPDGRAVAQAGLPPSARDQLPQGAALVRLEQHGRVRRVLQPITPNDIAVPGENLDPPPSAAPAPLGYVALEVSREGLRRDTRALVATGAVVTLLGLLVGGWLALRLNGAVTRELSARKDEAEAATAAKSRFIAAASHDLRQPMHALGLSVERLDTLPHDEAARPVLANVRASVQSLQDLLDALLDLSRLEAGAVPAVEQPVEVAALWERLLREFAPAAAQAGLRLRARPCAAWVRSDPALLHRMLLNVLSNAIRYTEHGGVLLACRRRGELAWLEVWDTGVGIPHGRQTEVFDEFVQLGEPRRGEPRGAGLGLAIVARTARLLQHRLELRSRPGRGTCLRIVVPLAEPAPPAEAPRPRPAAPRDLAGLCVLVLDDDPLARAAMQALLVSWGCEVMAAATPGEALERAAARRPDVIASDYRLGQGENGLACIARLRERLGQDTPAFLMSGDTDAALAGAAQHAGLVLLHKPVRPARLRALLQRLSVAGM
jgi:signal transduction histidine kinase/CheY-like chemotaxis protein